VPFEKPEGGWQGEVGQIDETMIKRYVGNERRAVFYISGPQPMVLAFEKKLSDMGVGKSHIKADYFPGYATI